MKEYSFKQRYVTSQIRSSIRLFVFSDSAVFDKVSTANPQLEIMADMVEGH